MTLKGGASQACAVCKYQRRRCLPDCPLAPYFPADEPKKFQNAHKLFGVSNILKILKELDESQKPPAMRSIICQANLRDTYPVMGSCHVIQTLWLQIQQAQEELQAVYAQLEMYRQHNPMTSVPDDVPSQLELGMAPPDNGVSLFQQMPQSYNSVNAFTDGSCMSYNSSVFMDPKDPNCMWMPNSYVSKSNFSHGIHSQLPISQTLSMIQQEEHYDEVPFFIDDRQSYIDSREGCESSSEESLKDTTESIEHVGGNELKSAAACFSLTSVN